MSDTVVLKNSYMHAVFDKKRAGFISLTSPFDGRKADFLLTPEEFPEYDVDDCKWLGHVSGGVNIDGVTQTFSTGSLRQEASIDTRDGYAAVLYPDVKSTEGISLGFEIESAFSFEKDILRMDITVKNTGGKEISLETFGVPLLMNQYFRIDDDFKYDRCVMRHTCVVGHDSYIYWEKSSGNGPVLLMAPLDGTTLIASERVKTDVFVSRRKPGEAFEGLFNVYPVKADAPYPYHESGAVTFGASSSVVFSFGFALIESEKNISDCLYSMGKTVVKVLPGMAVPVNEPVQFMSRSPQEDIRVEPLEAGDRLGQKRVMKGWTVTELIFKGYGRRYVRVRSGNRTSVYCFFAIEPVKDIIDKHAEFIVKNHFETDPEDPCYHGILMWDMVNKKRINSKFNPYDDWMRGGSDEIGLVGGLYLSEKNVYRPCEEEIKALQQYVADFILDRLTEQPGWRVHRMVPWYTMFEPWAGNGADDVWRAFNYVHVVNTLYNMYCIQKLYHFKELQPGKEYLMYAYEYTKAMFHYWMFPDGVGATEFGNMGEMTFPLYLEEALREEGYETEAVELGELFDRKAAYFASKQFPFGSEMPYDSTAFEAVYAYGARMDNDHVMRSAARASYSNRGKQPVWYLYCTDLRAGGDTSWNTSYMTQLGAYPILDYALCRGNVDEDWIITYYGSYLGGWIIYNSGGYWSDAAENEGASGWITDGTHINVTGRPNPKGFPFIKGCVAVSGEAELGFFGALRTACSIVLEHSILGRIGLGCSVKSVDGIEHIIPNDGLSMRFYHVPLRLRLEIDRDVIESIDMNGTDVTVHIKSYSKEKHKLNLSIFSIPPEGEAPGLLYREALEIEGAGISHSITLGL